MSNADGKRPDLQLWMQQKSTLVDVTIRHPAAPSHAHSSRIRLLNTANQSQREKQRKYKDLTKETNADFVTFACETFGGIAEEGRELIKDICITDRDFCFLWSAEDIQTSLPAAIAITIQRCNALTVLRSRTTLARTGASCSAA